MKNIVCAFLFFSSFVFSRELKAIDLYAMGSYWEIEDAEGTWGAGAGLAVPLFTEHLKLDARAYAFENNDFDNDDKLELIPMDLGLQLHLLPSAGINPYLLGGASYIYADADRIDIDSDVGAYAGAGLDLSFIAKIKIFAEVVYRFAELDSDSFRDEELDVSGMTANAGLKISF